MPGRGRPGRHRPRCSWRWAFTDCGCAPQAVMAPSPFPGSGPARRRRIVQSSALHVPPVASNGLLGRYYANGNWEEPPAFTRIDPQINLYFHDIPLPRPYTVEWRGKLAVAPRRRIPPGNRVHRRVGAVDRRRAGRGKPGAKSVR